MPAIVHQGDILTVGAPASGQECLVAILFLDRLVLVCDIFDRLIPADALPLITAAKLSVGLLGGPVFPLHGVLETVGAETLLLLCLATDAAALLRIIRGVGMRVVCLLPDNNSVLHQDLVHATPAAVMPAGCCNPLSALVVIHDRSMLFGCDRLRRGEAALPADCAQTCNRGRCRHTPFQEVSAAELTVQDFFQCHSTVLLL